MLIGSYYLLMFCLIAIVKTKSSIKLPSNIVTFILSVLLASEGENIVK